MCWEQTAPPAGGLARTMASVPSPEEYPCPSSNIALLPTVRWAPKRVALFQFPASGSFGHSIIPMHSAPTIPERSYIWFSWLVPELLALFVHVCPTPAVPASDCLTWVFFPFEPWPSHCSWFLCFLFILKLILKNKKNLRSKHFRKC